ncbi:hypothetical protein ACUN9Y_19830 [Halomonas sp. V046]|uniref:hypothetical protein n=1 Tax=Halomonas sp. V046 TaxID=3459611 RepID=UPI004043CC89
MPLENTANPSIRRPMLLGVTALATSLGANGCLAGETTASVYLWSTDVSQDLKGGASVETDSRTVLENLDFGLMGAIAHRSDAWMYGLDALYADIGKDGSVDVPVEDAEPGSSGAIDTVLDFSTKTTFINAYIGHQWFERGDWSIYGTAGLRFTRFETELVVDADGLGAKKFNTQEDVTDATFGLRGNYNVATGWKVPFVVDVGTGGSDVSFQAYSAAQYHWGNSSVTAGYRYMKWKLRHADYLDEVVYEGPVLAYSYSF